MEPNNNYNELKAKRDKVEQIMEIYTRESEELRTRAVEYEDKPRTAQAYITSAQHKTNQAEALREAVIAMDEKLERMLQNKTKN